MTAHEGICHLRKTGGPMRLALIFISLLHQQFCTAGATARPIVVTGHVTDAESQQPIKSFTVTPGYAGDLAILLWPKANRGVNVAGDYVRATDLVLWAETNATSSQDGIYRLELETGGSNALILAHADGFAPEVMPVGASSILNFKLHKSHGFNGKVVGANGRPIGQAQVAFGLKYGPLELVNGWLGHIGHPDDTYVHDSPIALSDGDGNFNLPVAAGAVTIFATHLEDGFAQIPIEQAEKEATIQLQPWARVKGVLRQEGKPLKNETVWLRLRNPQARGFIFQAFGSPTITDPEGRFAFEQVPPGDFNLFRQLGGRYYTNGITSGGISFGFITNGEPIQDARFPNSAIKTESGKTTVVELDAALQEPIPNETNADSSSAQKSRPAAQAHD